MTEPTDTPPTPRFGYRFRLFEQNTEIGWGDALAEFMTTVAVATFRLVQWCITIGFIRALNKLSPNGWLVALEGLLWIMLAAYVFAHLTMVEIDVFKEVDTRWKRSINLLLTLLIAGALLYATHVATKTLIDLVSVATKP